VIDFVIPLADWINAIFEVVSFYLSPVLRSSSVLLESIIKQFENILIWPPEVVVMIIVGAIVWKLSNYRLAIFAVLGFLISYGIGVWEETMSTIALALSGTAVSLLFGSSVA